MADSKIDWLQRPGYKGKVWNPVCGCTKIAQGCRECYAERIHTQRYEAYWNSKKVPEQYAKPFNEIQLLPQRLKDPLHWKKPCMVFVNSVSDLFHEKVPDSLIMRVFGTMIVSSHTFIILTKRPKRMFEFTAEYSIEKTALPFQKNIWMGYSASTQKEFDEGNKYLLRTPAAKRIVSLEPLIENINLEQGLGSADESNRVMNGWHGIDWVIVGGESGPNARPMHPAWVRNIKDQCQAAKVAFYFKQWGEFTTAEQCPLEIDFEKYPVTLFEDGIGAYKVGKSKAGHLLDGVEYRQFPDAA